MPIKKLPKFAISVPRARGIKPNFQIKIDYKKCCWKNGKCVSCSCKSGSCCNGCVEACPVQALKRAKKVEFDKSKCISCGACVSACKHNAISVG